MEDWKKQMDDKFKDEKRQKRIHEQKQREDEEKKTMEIHKQRFQCHICQKPSSGPCEEFDFDKYPSNFYNWDRPIDLKQCQKCGKWTCKEHIHRDICKNCT